MMNQPATNRQREVRDRLAAGESFVEFARAEIEQSIPERFEAQAAKHAPRLAVRSPRHEFTYEELNGRANQVARVLIERGAPAGGRVAVFMENDAPAAVAILAVLKCGGTYVPLEPQEAPSRNLPLLVDSDARLILTTSDHLRAAAELAGTSRAVVNMDELDGDLPAPNPSPAATPDSLAYIFYTSGSTGRPKGVADTHRNVLHNIMRYTNSLRISRDDRMTLLTSPGFSGSVSSLFGALLNGAAVFPYDLRRDRLDRLGSWLSRERISIYHSVPSIFRAAAENSTLDSLRLVRLEGDQASIADVELYKRATPPGCVLVNGLGATECGLVRQFFVDKDTDLDSAAVPLGYDVEDMEVLVLDEAGKPVEAGEVGEIAVRSRYLAPGYWQRADLTGAAFRDDPQDPGMRVYRTGDLGKMLSDGRLDFVGRRDYNAKVMGLRVDLAAVEAALAGVEPVSRAVAVVRDDGSGEGRLAAYIVAKGGSAPTVTSLRMALAGKLPDYMIPSAFVAIDAVPLTPSGKVDRGALPPPGRARPRLETAFVGPRTPIEKDMVDIWSEVLEVDGVGLDDNFFELGGNSLSAVKVVSRILSRFRAVLPLKFFFESPTVGALAFAVAQRLAAEVEPEDVEDLLDELEDEKLA